MLYRKYNRDEDLTNTVLNVLVFFFFERERILLGGEIVDGFSEWKAAQLL